MKRLYKLVSLSDDLILMLDGKPVKTPDGHTLCAPNKNIGERLMREWSSQEIEIIPSAMPFTQFLSTKFDRIIPQRAEIEAGVLKYLDTDLICYRAENPPELAVLQAQNWDVWLAFFEKRFGVLKTTSVLQALKQDSAVAGKVKAYIHALDDDRFNILQLVTSVSGSLVLALAFVEQEISPAVLFKAIRVEEDYKASIYNEEKYGPEDIQAKRDQSIRADLDAAALFLQFLNH